jgi:hypothetical protein
MDTTSELHKAEHELAEAIALEQRAEKDVAKAEHLLQSIEEKLSHESHIKVNGRGRTIEGRKVSYEEAIKFAFPHGPSKPDVRYTVTYHNALKPHHAGELDAGQSVIGKHGRKPHEETVFNVTETVLS